MKKPVLTLLCLLGLSLAWAQTNDTVVEVATNDALGPYLVGADGMSLYLFLNDSENMSACYDRCAENWPPLLVEGELGAGEGVDASLLGTTERTDGAVQATYNGWPLYYWVNDEAPGDITGQDVGEVWYLLSPAGEQIGGEPMSGGDDSSDDSSDDSDDGDSGGDSDDDSDDDSSGSGG